MKLTFKTSSKLAVVGMIVILAGILLGIRACAKDGKLTVMFSSGGSGNTLAASAEEFTKVTGIETEVLLFPYAELHNKVVLALSQGGPIPDVVPIDDIWVVELAGFCEPLHLEEQEKERFVRSMLEMFRWPQLTGSYCALPVRIGGDVIVYRTDVFAEKGIDPANLLTWSDILDVAIKLTEPTKRTWGWTLAYTPFSYLVSEWGSGFLGGFNVPELSPDQKRAAFNTEAGIRATQIFVDLFEKACSPGAIGYEYWDKTEAMKTGMITLGMLYTSHYPPVNDPAFPYYGKFGVLRHFPYGKESGLDKGRPYLKGWGLGINKYSANKELARKFIEFVTSEDEQLRLALEHSNSPTVESVFHKPEYLEAISVASEMAEALENARPRPYHLKWAKIEDIIGEQLHEALLGEVTVEDALATAERRVNTFLSE